MWLITASIPLHRKGFAMTADTVYAQAMFLQLLQDKADGIPLELSSIMAIDVMEEERKAAVLKELVRLGAIESPHNEWLITDKGRDILKKFGDNAIM